MKSIKIHVAAIVAVTLLTGCAAPVGNEEGMEIPVEETVEAAVEETAEAAVEEISTEKAEEATTAVFASTTGGEVMGYRYENVDRYLGIPYATAERFQLPVPTSWEGIRPCLNYGEVCPQNRKEKSAFNLAEAPAEMVENEDKCLNLNVWTPETGAEELKPVIVWLHGGGFSSGSSYELASYSGANLADYGNVVFVSINHRLNCLGFLDMSAYGEEYKYSGNAGMTDLIFALQWIQDNIEQFGGDPNNVTIDGQSGGGAKVTTLMGIPEAAGLFQKAIAQSAATDKPVRSVDQAQKETATVLEILGLGEEETYKLAEMDYEDLYHACSEAGVSYAPVIDGDLYPDGTMEISKDIPLIVGNVLGEFSSNYVRLVSGNFESEEAWSLATLKELDETEVVEMYQAVYGDSGEAIMQAFMEAYPDHKPVEGLFVNNHDPSARMTGDRIVEAFEECGGQAYQFLVAYSYPMFGGVTAIHTASDVPFFFRNLDTMGMYIAGDEEAAYELSDLMSTAMINFLYTGNPSLEGLEWTTHNGEEDNILIFDVNSAVKSHHDDELMRLLTEN